MEQSTEAVYTAPLVMDAGDVTEVTLGTNQHDSADDTEYKV
ncbi:lasso RiPP family leader peptide-containing protein [Streptomyces decoyicus]